MKQPQITPIHRIVFPDISVPAGSDDLYFQASGGYCVLGRRSIQLDSGTRVSFGTYFGAVPLVVWQQVVSIQELVLSGFAESEVLIRVLSTDAEGQVREVWQKLAAGEFRFTVPVDKTAAGWLWLECEASSGATTLTDLCWELPAPPLRKVSLSVAITTFNRTDDCLALVHQLSTNEELRAQITQITVVDQGTQRLADHPDLDEIQLLWRAKLTVVEQPNLGGSGGFSRGMLAALQSDSSHVLLLDDDVVLEPESVIRMMTLSGYSEDDPLVGAQMLSLSEPMKLHSWGEIIDRRRFWWHPLAPQLCALDVGLNSPERTALMSKPVSVDYNGWWMCLIPVKVVEKIGLSLPLFIKWDDAEFGLRAGQAGHRTITLPGAALWHVPWSAKDDGLDWQAYFQLRNRLVAALIHSPFRRGGSLLREVFALDVNHLLCMQYGSAAVRHQAVTDLMQGPEHLFATLAGQRERVSKLLAGRGQVLSDRNSNLQVLHQGVPRAPRGRVSQIRRVLAVLLHQIRRSKTATTANRVDANLPRNYGKWWSLGLLDSAYLGSAADQGGFLLRRNRRDFFKLLRSSCALAIQLYWAWPRLARQYRAAAPQLSSADEWQKVFANNTPPKA